MLWEKPKIYVAGQELSFFSDLCPLTLRKIWEFKFLTVQLVRLGIPYRWGFPFELPVAYQRRTVVIRTVQQAIDFESELTSEEVEVEVLNEQDWVQKNNRRIPVRSGSEQ